MSETSDESNTLTIKQLRNILRHDHIRKHLVQTGYIDEHGNVIRTTKENSQLKRPQTSKTRRSHPSNASRLPSASTKKKTKTSARFSSINQSTVIPNVLLRRAVSPKLLYPDERCCVTLKYLGPDLNIDYDREYFEPQGDEILILQQHCGGENSPVVKCFLKPNETITFYSRRHTDYPFALAFYLNGVIKDRLSVCCESRCHDYMPIGGKRSLIAIVKVENGRPCRRCRYEQRIKKLLESESNSFRLSQRDFIKMNIERVSKSKSPKRELSKSQSARESINSNPEPNISQDGNFSHIRSEENKSTSPPPVTKKSPRKKATNTSSSRSISSRSPSPERETTTIQSKKIGSSKPTASKKTSSPPQVSSGETSPEPTASKKTSSPPQVSSGETSPEPTASKKTSSPPQVSSGATSPEPTASKRTTSKKTSSPPQVSSGETSPKLRSSPSHQQKSSEISTPDTTLSHIRSSNQPMTSSHKNVNRSSVSDEERTPSPPTQNHFSTSNNSSQFNNGPNSHHSDRNDEEKAAYSLTNKPQIQSFSPSSIDNRNKNPPHISTDDESEGEVVTLTDESNSDFNRFSHTDRRRNDTSD